MSAKITPARLEMVRLTREHCYGVLEPTAIGRLRSDVNQVAEALLEQPVETLAGWVQLDETVLANIRLLFRMTEQTVFEPVNPWDNINSYQNEVR